MRKQSLMRWGLPLSPIAFLSLGGMTFYLCCQLTQIPTNLKTTPDIASRSQRHQALLREAFATVRKIGSRFQELDQRPITRLNAEELNAFFAHSLAINLEQQSDSSILMGTNIEILDSVLKTTALIDLSEVTESSLNGSRHRLSLLRRILKIPGVRDRPIAITVEGQPMVRDRILGIDNPIISIGKIRLTTPQAVQWLGISEAILLERLEQEWAGFPMELDRVSIGHDIDHDNSTPWLQLEGDQTAW